MKISRFSLWGRRVIAVLLCAAIALSVPLCLVPAATALPQQPEIPITSDLSANENVPVSADEAEAGASLTPPETTEGAVVLPETQSTPAPSVTPEPQDVSAPETVLEAQTSPAFQTTPAQVEETVWAGETLTFVDLMWKTTPLNEVDALFTGSQGQEPVRLSMTAADRGQYTVTVPEGGYDQVAFYAAGTENDTLGGVWRLSDGEDGGNTVDFAPLTLSAFYYDSGENPSYWGGDPNYDPEAMGISLMSANTLAETGTEEGPKPGQQVYFVNMHALEGSETDPIVTVEARFIQWPHDGASDAGWTDGGQYLARTMYEVRDGIYVTSFPVEIDSQPEEAQSNCGGYLYQEISFDLTRRSGQETEFNRHYNFRGQKSSEAVDNTWGRPGWFTYQEGTMDTYFYNTSVEDSYWNAHPSNADASIQAQLLYIDTRDFSETEGNTPYQDVTDIYLSWEGMPTDLKEYNPQYGVRLGVTQAGQENPYALSTKGIYYFKMPSSGESLTENTVFTLTYVIAKGEHTGIHTFLFTYVPRSGRNTILMDYLWEDVGEVWGVYQSQPAGESTSRNVYFNNAVTAFGKVQVVFGKYENGEVTFMDGQASWDAAQSGGWASGKLANQGVDNYQGWGNGWLNMTEVDSHMLDGHELPDNVWVFENVPVEYDYVMFRGAIDRNAADSNKDQVFWFSTYLKIDQTYQYPCFFAYAYLGTKSNGAASDGSIKPGDKTEYLDGQWGSALEIYNLGDDSAQIPEGDYEPQDNTYYGITTLYDYYSFWEMSGRPVTEGRGNGEVNKSNYIYERQGVLFDLAVSQYFKNLDSGAADDAKSKPLYFGASNLTWSEVLYGNGAYSKYARLYGIEDLNLYGNNDYANGWVRDDGPHYGLIDSDLDRSGNVTLNGLSTPYFDENFLRGDNDLGIVVGNVYNNIRFPFRLNDEGYWAYNSAEYNRTLKQDPDGTYYMEETDPFYINGYGASYMPFSEASQGFGSYANQAETANLNYMFSQRLDLTFTVPEGGQVNMPDANGTEQMKDVIFEFQGDDDCWIFIDGQRILDMGGIHDAVRGTINFRTGEWKIYSNIDGKSVDNQGNPIDMEIVLDDSGEFQLSGDENTEHTLTMFYMERGLYASNLKIVFNFPQQNTLRVTKEVDTSSVNSIFGEAMENLGGFEMQMSTMATSGNPLAVEDSAGYIQTDSKILYTPDGTGTAIAPTQEGGQAEVTTDGEFLKITQPTGWTTNQPPDTEDEWEKYLLTLTPPDTTINLDDVDGDPDTEDPLAFLELELYNNTTENRGAELYIQLQDKNGNLVTGTARTLGYLGEANLFLPNTRSLVRIDLDSLVGANTAFDRNHVTAVRIGLLNGTGTGENAGNYQLYRAAFGTEWNRVLPAGFSVGDNQISDYGSLQTGDNGKLAKGVFQPVDGAWYTRQTHDSGGNVIESISSVVQNGSFSLSDGQTAVFTDKFRVGSYIRLQEIVDKKLFETTWSIREDGEPVSFNSLLYDRFDAPSVINPQWGFSKGETPLENQFGTVPDDGRNESIKTGNDLTYEEKNGGFVYRGYLYPDNNENLPINLEVIFTNRMLTGEFTITKQLHEDMGVEQTDGTRRYPVGTYTFDVYYTDVAGRGLEQYLPDQPEVEGVGTKYVHQVIEITTDEANGQGSYTMEGIPAGTQYIIRERPANGATLVGLTAQPDEDAVQGVTTGTDGNKDYTRAYIQSEVTVTDATTDGSETVQAPNYTFTNKNDPFFMTIQKVWDDPEPEGLTEIRIEVQRRKAGSKDAWEPVTSDFFGDRVQEGQDYIVLSKENEWTVQSDQKVIVYPSAGTGGEGKNYLYEYRIVEIGVGQGDLAGYRVVYDQIAGKPQGDYPVVVYRARNSATGLTLQKTWLDNENRDKVRPTSVRVRLERSTQYDPKDPNAENVQWEVIDEKGRVQDPADPDTAYITLQSPIWSYTLEGLPVTDGEGKPYYYRVQEVQVLDETNKWVSLESQETYEPAYSQPVTLNETAVITVENALRTAAIQVTKTDAQNYNTKLPGAKFQLNRLIQTGDGSWVVDTSWDTVTKITDDKGVLTFDKLRPGHYRLTEIVAPKGYQVPYTPVDVTLQADNLGETVHVTVKNSTPQTFTFIKVAAENHSQTLSGAGFLLYPLVCGDTSHTHDELLDTDAPGACWGTEPLTGTSDANGVVTFANLPAGLYRLVETKAPGGYALPTGQWNVTLQADGSADMQAVGEVPAFLEENGAYKLPNRKPLDMPSSGGPGVPIAAALGTMMMGGGAFLAVCRPRPRRKKRKTDPKQ